MYRKSQYWLLVNVKSLSQFQLLNINVFHIFIFTIGLLYMGANHGRGLGGLGPPEILLGGLAMDPAPQKNQVLAPILFVI